MPEGPIPVRDPNLTRDAIVVVTGLLIAAVAGVLGFAAIWPPLALLYVAGLALIVVVWTIRGTGR